MDLERAIDGGLAPVTKLDGVIGEMRTNDRYLLALAGPWSAPVTVIASDDTNFRFGTLRGHFEAGVIEFRVEQGKNELTFIIESWARSGDQAIRLLYDVLGIARILRAELWLRMCEHSSRWSVVARSGLFGSPPSGPARDLMFCCGHAPGTRNA